MYRVFLIAAAAAFAATPAAAQHAHPPAPPPRQPAAPTTADHAMADCPMQAMMMSFHHLAAFRPDTLVRQARTLRLDAQQEAQLARLAAASRAAHDSLHSAAATHRAAFEAAARAESPDPAAVTGHFEAMHSAMGAAHLTQLRAALSARALLTAGQRALVAPPPSGAMHRPMGGHDSHGAMCW